MISKKIKIIILSIIFSFNLSAAPSSESDRSILLSSSNQSKYAEIFNNNCVSCHSGGVPRAPHLTTFQVMSADYILSTLNGVMSSQAEGLSEKEKILREIRELLEHGKWKTFKQIMEKLNRIDEKEDLNDEILTWGIEKMIRKCCLDSLNIENL